MHKALQRIVVLALLFFNLVSFAGLIGAAAGTAKPPIDLGLINNGGGFPPADVPANLAFASNQFGFTGPLNVGVNYNELTGAYITGQYVEPIFNNFALGLIGEYGLNQYRLNATLGFELSDQDLFKFTLERFNQNLPFLFDSGSINQRVAQDAFGARYQRMFSENVVFKGIDAGVYHSQAYNVKLDPLFYFANGSNRLGSSARLQSINYRNIAGGVSTGFDLGFTALLSPKTLVQARLNYDDLYYRTEFGFYSPYNARGFGATVNIEQLINSRLKFNGGFEARAIYNSFSAAIVWLAPFLSSANAELSFFFQRVISSNLTPDNNNYGLRLNFLGDTAGRVYQINSTSFLPDLKAWVSEPAVKMSRVLAVAEQIIHIISPRLHHINPNSGPASGGNVVSLMGSNFPPTAQILIDGQAAAVQYKSSQHLAITIPSARQLIVDKINSTGLKASVDVVLMGEGGYQIKMVNGYFYTATPINGFAPQITAIEPNEGSVEGGTMVHIVGTNLDGVLSVTIGDEVAAIVSNSPTEIVVMTKPHAAGVVSVVVQTITGITQLDDAYTFSVQDLSATTISPNLGSVDGHTQTTIMGTNLNRVTAVFFGSIPASSFVINNDTTITAITPAYADGSLTVNVTLSDGTTNATLANAFTYQLDTPTISTINPNKGPLAGGTTIEITGSNFSSQTTVSIGGILASKFVFIDSNHIKVNTPAHVTGSLVKDVLVNTGSGGVTLTGGFTYLSGAVRLSGLTPSSGSISGGTTVKLVGSGFTSGTTVTFAETPATNVQLISSTELNAVTPAHVSGKVDVKVDSGKGSAVLEQAFEYLANAPILTGISPTGGSVAGGITISLTGTNLDNINAVTIGGVPATDIKVVNNTMVTAVVPAYVSGDLKADVEISDGRSSSTLVDVFSYQAMLPKITTINPNSGPFTGGFSAIIHGSGFIPGTTVSIGAVVATNVIMVNASTLELTIPIYVSGLLTKDVSVNNGMGMDILTGGFSYIAQAPTLTHVSPTIGSVAGGTLITLTGTGFTPTTMVSVGGVAATQVVIINSTSLTAVIPAYSGGNLSADVVVNNGVSNAHLSNAFLYQAVKPSLTHINPGTGPAEGGTSLTLTGSGFVPGMTVTVGDVAATNVAMVSTTTMTAITPAYMSGSLTKDVTVSNTAGSGNLTDSFTYTLGTPTITSINPNVGSVAGGTTIMINGTGFTPGTTVSIGGNLATEVVVLSSTSLTALVPAYTGGDLSVQVQVDNGIGVKTVDNGFTYHAIAPKISNSTPASGSVDGGTILTITGSGFVPGTKVIIGDIEANQVSITSPTTLTAVTPTYINGSLEKIITVDNAKGSDSLNAGFTYIAKAPSITTLSPNKGSIDGGTSVMITGSGFVPGMLVSFDNLPAINIQVLSTTSATAITPAHASGLVDVSVDNGSEVFSFPSSYTYIGDNPSLTSLSPSTGSAAGGTAITLTGTNLSGITSVTVGGVAASSVVVVNSTTVTAVVPAYVNGPLLTDVTASDGSTNATLASAFTYQAVNPSITNISPNTSSVAGGISAIITGSGFVPGTLISIGGVAASSVTVVDANTITIVVPAYVSGLLTKNVTVNNGVGEDTLSAAFYYTPVAPTILNITPTSGPLGGGSFITIVGSGFSPDMSVSVGGIAATQVTVVNSQKITAIIPAYVRGELTVDITVANSVSNDTLSNVFTYQPISPSLTRINPASGPASGGTTITLDGDGFLPGSTVSVGGVQASNVVEVDVHTITATVPAYVNDSLIKDVTINNNSGSATLNNSYTYTVNAPTLTQVNSNSGSIAGGTVITLTGTGFTPFTTVRVGGVNATSVSFISTTLLSAVVPAYVSGPLLVSVDVNNGVSNASLADSFTYQAISPSINNVTPPTGTINGGTSITVTGSGFVPDTVVTIGGVAATSITIQNSSTLVAVAPAYVNGLLAKDVIVDNGAGSFSLAGGFTYIADNPTITTVSPSSGSTSGGTTLQISGSSFVPGTSVMIGGVPATNVQLINSTELTAVTPAHASGAVEVTVDNGVGSITRANGFDYFDTAPILSSISPNSGSVVGGITITLTGTSFGNISTVTVGGVAATNIAIVNDTTITAVVPAYINGSLTADVEVSDGSSNSTLVAAFNYQALAPHITSIEPNSSSIVGGINAIIHGSGFIPGTAVSIGDVAATNVSMIDANTLNLTIPAYVSGLLQKDVLVNNGVGSDQLTGGFSYTVAAPTLTGLSPSTGSVVGGTLITITGTGFTPTTTVSVGGLAAAQVVVSNSTSLTAVTPAYSGGDLSVGVTVNNGVSDTSQAAAFLYQPVQPTLTNVSPSTGFAVGGTILTLTGSGFVPGMTVTVGGIAAINVVVNSTTTMTAETPAYVTGPTTADVVVSNAIGSGYLGASFTYLMGAPTVTGISPNLGSIAGGTTITIAGSGFIPGTTVTIGGNPATTVEVLSSTSLTAVTPAYTGGDLSVQVQVDNGVSVKTIANGFTYQAIAPNISSSTPMSGTVDGGTIITLSGGGFVPGTTVTIGGIAASSVSITDVTTLTAVTPAYVSGPLAKTIMVNNGEGSDSLNAGFTYVASAPSITTLSPNSGSVSGGTTVIITGTGFVPGMILSFDGLPATNVQVLSATSATAITPAHASALVNVGVDNGSGAGEIIFPNSYTYVSDSPVLLNVSPATGWAAGGTSITLTGTNLSGITSVMVGGVAASSVAVVNSTTVTAVVPAYVSGSLLVDVTVSDGSTNTSLAQAFTYQIQAPSITSISPDTSSVAGGISATIKGANFAPGTLVSIGGVAARSIAVVDVNTMLITVPAYVSGLLTKDVTVDNGVGLRTLDTSFTYTPVTPTISGLFPASGALAGGTMITLTGTGFTINSTVSVGDYPATGVVFINSTTMTAITPAYINGPINADVTVANGGSNTTLGGGFTYIASSPTIASINPNEGSVSGGTVLNITGTNFTPNTTINIGSVAALNVNVLNATTLTATTPAYVSGPLLKDVTINNGVDSLTISNSFTYQPNTPTLANIAPTTGALVGGTLVTLTGTNFTPDTGVSFGGVPATNINLISSTSLTAVVPEYTGGALTVDVMASNGSSNAVLREVFTYEAAAPTIATITPNSGPMSGGTGVIVTGTNFVPGTTLSIGGVSALNVVIVNSTTITGNVPAYTGGSLAAEVTVNNGITNVSLDKGFTYQAQPPLFTSITPNTGSIDGGTTVIINGANFTSTSTVSLDGIAATNVQVLNANTISALTPVHASGQVELVVDNGMAQVSQDNAFTYVDNGMKFTGVNPSSGSVAGGTTITLTGANLLGVTDVTVNGIPASNVVVVDSATVTATLPAYLSGSLNAVVTVSDGSTNISLAGVFTYLEELATVFSLTPNTGSIAGGTMVSVSGSGFTPDTTVSVGGIAATNVVFTNQGNLSFSTPAYVSGSLLNDVSFTNAAGTYINPGSFTYTAIAPTLARISPNTGSVAGGTSIMLTGSGFTPNTVVTIGGVPAISVTINNAGSLTAVTPAYFSGSLAADVVVDNGLSNASLKSGFSYQPVAPTIATITPSLGSMAGGTAVTVSGANFTPSTTMAIGGVGALSIQVVNAGTLTAVTPVYVNGYLSKDVTVTNEVTSDSLGQAYTYLAIPPALTLVTPNVGPLIGGTTITLTGTGFTPNTTVTVGGIAATSVLFNSATSLTAVTPAYVSGVLASDVVVTNELTNAKIVGGFVYQASQPSIGTISPNTGTVLGGTSVTITGDDFIPGTTVTIGGIAASVNVVDSSTLVIVTPLYVSGLLAKDVVLNNGISSVTSTKGFTYLAVTPSVSTISPNVGSIVGGTAITITGSNFTPDTTVIIGGVPAVSVVVNNLNSLTAITPAYISGELNADVTIDNGFTSVTVVGGFIYQAIAPTFSGVSPSSGSVAGNAPITITGTGFTPTTSVSIGGIPATNVNVIDATSLTANTPAYVSGPLAAAVAVNNGVASVSVSGAYTYTAVAPLIDTIIPNSGSIAGGTKIVISGSGFTSDSTVNIDGIAATNVVFVNTTTLTAVTPAHTSGTVGVEVSNSASSVTLSNGFSYQELAPNLIGVSPSSGSVEGGTSITLTGINLIGSTDVSINGIPATNVVVVDDATVTATVPAYQTGALSAEVTIGNSSLNSSLQGVFTYLPELPVNLSLTPNTGSIAGGTMVNVTGSGFTPDTTVTVGGIPATNVVFSNQGSLSFSTPAYVSGALFKSVRFTNGAGTVSAGFTYTAIAPALTAINPNLGSVIGGTPVTLTGAGFTPNTVVTIGSVSATAVNVINANSLTAVTPVYLSGPLSADVVVDNGLSNAKLIGGFNYQPIAPTLATITPNTGSMVGGTAVTINGGNFTPNTTVTIGGISALNIQVLNASTITAVIPAYVSGYLTKDVVVNNGVTDVILGGGYTYVAVAPTVLAIAPNTGSTAGGTPVVINGTGFTPVSTVTIGGVAVSSVNVTNANTLTAVTPAYVNGPLAASVAVTNEASIGSLLGGFTYESGIPNLTGITPNSGAMAGGTTVVLVGSNFTPTMTVSIGGVAATDVTMINSSSATATVPAYVSGPLLKDVTINNGVASVIFNSEYTYLATIPSFSGVSPSSGSVAGNTSITITGTGFTPNTSVTIGGVPATNVNVIDATTLTANTPAYVSGPLAAAVAVNNGVSTVSLAGAFTYLAVAPSITAITPNSGSIAGGTTILINGSGFTSGTTVSLGGIAATAVVFVNTTTLTAVTPVHANGLVDVMVANGVLSSTLHNGFNYQTLAPNLTNVSPSSGSVTGGTSITLTGTNFTGTTSVSLNGVAASNVAVVNDSTVTATVPAYQNGPLTVAVTIGNGSANSTLAAAFTYLEVIPSVVTLTPNAGSVAGGTTVNVSGSGFSSDMTITLDGIAVTNLVVSNQGSLSFTTPAYTGGSLVKDVLFANQVGNIDVSGGFTYTPIAPTLATISPNSGSVLGGTTFILTGTGFTPATTVTIGGVAATSVSVTSATSIIAVTPAYVSGLLAADVVVDNGVSNASLKGGFSYQPVAPTIATISPNSGSVIGGAAVTISGSNFTPSTTVTIGGLPALSIQVVNANTITAITPAYVSQSLVKDVVVTNEVASKTLSGAYTYTAVLPTLINISPNSGTINGGTTIIVIGAGFTPTTTVTIGGIVVSNINVVNASMVTAVTPAYVSGPLLKTVKIINEVGTATATGGYTYIPVAPTVLTITPNNGSTAGGTSVVISGTGFTPASTVAIGGVAANSVNVTSANSLTAVIPAYVNGSLAANVAVTNEASTGNLLGGFTYQSGTPSLTSITPNMGSVAGGTTVVLVGSNFTPTMTVNIGGVAATNVTMINSTSATATVPAYMSGPLAADVIINNGVSMATLSTGYTYQATVPTFSGIAPNTGSVAGNTPVTITGTGFTPTTSLSIGGIPATNINVINATSLTANTPAYVSGSLAAVVAVNNGVSTVSVPGAFTYTAVTPAITMITPSSGSIAGGTTIVISGSGFTSNTTVSLDGIAATSVVFVNTTTLTAVTPVHTNGLVDVMVANGALSSTLHNGFNYQTLAPNLTNVSPSLGSVTGGTSITLTGTNFTGTTSVSLNGVAASNVVVVNDLTVTATVPAYQSGSLAAAVTIGNGSANSTLSGAFTYQPVLPSVSSLTPNTGSIAGGTTVNVSGAGFTPDTTVMVGGIAATNVVFTNQGSISFSTPAYFGGQLLKDVSFTNGAGTFTKTSGFTYTAIAPTLATITPNSGAVAGGTSVSLTGSGFTPNTVVTIGGVAATSISITNAGSLTAVIPAYVSGALAADAVVDNGLSNAKLTGGFTYLPAMPDPITISPNSGTMAGGTAVTISGSNFTPSTTVTIGGIAALNIQVVNASTITAVTPAYVSLALVKDVVVTNEVGSKTLTGGFTYTTIAPTIGSITPNSGPVAGGTSIIVTGTGFTPSTTLSVGGIAASSVVVSSATSLTAVTPAYVSGTLVKDVTVNNGNSPVIKTGGFIYIASAPTLLSVTLNSGGISGGTNVTVTGTGFIPGTTLSFGGVAATNVTVVNFTTLTATTPAYVSGSLVVPVVVNNGISTSTLLNGFTYIASAPTITAITPNTGTSAGGTSVTITGTNFIPGTTATIGGVAVTSISVVNATSMTAVTPAYVSGSLTVNVAVNNSINTATLTNGYTYQAVSPNMTSCSYPGGILTTAWVCVGTNMNVFPNIFINVKGGLLCTAGLSISSLLANTISALNLGGNSLLPGLYSGCTIELCNNSTCTGLTSNIIAFS